MAFGPVQSFRPSSCTNLFRMPVLQAIHRIFASGAIRDTTVMTRQFPGRRPVTRNKDDC